MKLTQPEQRSAVQRERIARRLVREHGWRIGYARRFVREQIEPVAFGSLTGDSAEPQNAWESAKAEAVERRVSRAAAREAREQAEAADLAEQGEDGLAPDPSWRARLQAEKGREAPPVRLGPGGEYQTDYTPTVIVDSPLRGAAIAIGIVAVVALVIGLLTWFAGGAG